MGPSKLSTSSIGFGSVGTRFSRPFALFLGHSPRELRFPS